MSQSYSERFAQLELNALWSGLPELGDEVDAFDFQQRMAVYK
jgi:hypothetical protein